MATFNRPLGWTVIERPAGGKKGVVGKLERIEEVDEEEEGKLARRGVRKGKREVVQGIEVGDQRHKFGEEAMYAIPAEEAIEGLVQRGWSMEEVERKMAEMVAWGGWFLIPAGLVEEGTEEEWFEGDVPAWREVVERWWRERGAQEGGFVWPNRGVEGEEFAPEVEHVEHVEEVPAEGFEQARGFGEIKAVEEFEE